MSSSALGHSATMGLENDRLTYRHLPSPITLPLLGYQPSRLPSGVSTWCVWCERKLTHKCLYRFVSITEPTIVPAATGWACVCVRVEVAANPSMWTEPVTLIQLRIQIRMKTNLLPQLQPPRHRAAGETRRYGTAPRPQDVARR